MTIEQWNLLSNLIHCYDEYCGHLFVKRYIEEQNTLPAKFRHRNSSVKHLMTSIVHNIQHVFEKNRDFLSLSSISRTNLLRTTTQYNLSFGGVFMTGQHRLLDNELLCNSMELIFVPSSVASTKWIITQLDPDETFVKLVLAIVACSTTHSIVHVESRASNLIDTKTILSVENIYVELVWRYLLYRYNHREAVKRFSNIVRCLILLNNIVIDANQSRQFVELFDAVIEQIEHKLDLSDHTS